MSQLPSLNLVKIIYEYEDGSQYFLEGDGLGKHQEQLQRASFSAVTHGEVFDELDWQKQDEGKDPYN